MKEENSSDGLAELADLLFYGVSVSVNGKHVPLRNLKRSGASDPSREMAYELNNPNLKPNPEDKL